ncbi:MAG: RHS repeat-associated core domain-containing protein, partial [Bacteroidota bacterium]|nr:RHS repeat-associated core domain-containing protein [Bacteroidota bacterium]
PVTTGLITIVDTRNNIQQALDNTVYGTSSPRSYFVTRTNTGEIGYSDNSYPQSSDGTIEYLTVTYYDSYGFPNQTAFNTSANISNYTDSDVTSNGYFDNVKGLVTGTKTKVLGTSTWLTATNYYDDNYRVIESLRDLYDGSNGKEIASTLYDFVGKVKQTKQIQSFGSTTTTVEKWLNYDHAGRLTKTEQAINGLNRTTVNDLTYNEVGQLANKKLGGSAQNIDYKYNIRGWLTQINDPDNIDNNRLFGMKLLYDVPDASMGGSAQFNGNISGMIWNSTQKTKQGYAFTYDALNRLNSSDYKTNNGSAWSESTAYEEKGITYDVNGNINTLVRTDQAGSNLANYTYNYNGNQLQSLTGIGSTYTYDGNGNMTTDGLRSFSVSYNPLNLPETISKGSENISYIYSATGEKLAKRMKNNTYQYYAGGFVYNDDKSLNYFAFDEGRVKKVSSSFSYEYHLKDHLGNTRVAFEPSSSSTNTLQVADYYPFGSSFTPVNPNNDNKYLYNGKEKQDDVLGGTNLDWYDYGARFYDAQIGRWTTIDPLAEKYSSISPFVYCANNPIIFIDPNGMEFTGDVDAVNSLEKDAKDKVDSEKKAQARLRARAEKRAAKGKSTANIEKRIAKSEFREEQYQSTINEIGEMRSSETVYNVNTNFSSSDSDGDTKYAGKNADGKNVVNISVSQSYAQAGGLAHELVHGYQFEKGQIDFSPSGSPGVLYDITDEISAYQRQFAFTNNSAMYKVNESYVRGLTNASGSKLYNGLPIGPLNINTSWSLIQYCHTGKLSPILTPYGNLQLPYIHK